MAADVATALGGAYSLLFLSAFLGKADGWEAWQLSVSDLFDHRLLARCVLVGVPTVEAVIAVVLLARPQLGLVSAGLLLTAFGTVVLALNRREEAGSCSCFGALAPSSISAGLAARDFGLAALAGGAL